MKGLGPGTPVNTRISPASGWRAYRGWERPGQARSARARPPGFHVRRSVIANACGGGVCPRSGTDGAPAWGHDGTMGNWRFLPLAGTWANVLTLILYCDLRSLDGFGKEGSVSRAYLHCLTHEQRPRSVRKALTAPGSRRSAPWTLRSKRGLPQFTHTSLQPGSVRKCCAVWNWRERALQAKTAAFQGWASCRTHSFFTPTACRRQARTGTVPPFSPLTPMPP